MKTETSSPGRNEPIKLGENRLEVVESVKVLGVTIDSSLTFVQHIGKLQRSAAAGFRILEYLVSSLLHSYVLNVSDSFASCHFEYCSSVSTVASFWQCNW